MNSRCTLIKVFCLQFVYCCLVGTFPFNAFLSGFISCVGSFVLGVCLRLQVIGGFFFLLHVHHNIYVFFVFR